MITRAGKDSLLRVLFLLCAFGGVAGVVVIFVFVGARGLGIFRAHGVIPVLFGLDWSPAEGEFGMLPFIAGSFLVTVGALVIGAPLAIGTAVFLSEIAPPRLRAVVRPSVELLAGIPSVIYGFFALVFLVPFVRALFGGAGFSMVSGWLVLAIMILPTIAAISEDAVSAVPKGYRMSSLALGATRWQTIWRVVLPAAAPGIINAVVLGMGRAIGETMAVLMVLGNAPIVPVSATGPASTLTSIIALDMSYASGEHQTALFAMGIVLLIISTLLILLIRLLTLRRARV